MLNFTADEALKFKTVFAQKLNENPSNPFEAAIATFGKSQSATKTIMIVAAEWPFDEFVIAEQKRLIEGKPEKKQGMPTKEEFLQYLWGAIQEGQEVKTSAGVQKVPLVGKDLKDMLALYAQASGFIEKTPSVQVNNAPVNKVMIVKDFGTDDEWEEKLKKQQESLKNGK